MPGGPPRGPWQRDPAVRLFLWSRAAIWIGVLFSLIWFTPNPVRPPESPHDVGYAVDVWARTDSSFFLGIARSGYHAGPSTAFYPLYPALVGGLGRVLGGHYVLAGVVISLAACLGAFVLLSRLGRVHIGAEATSRALLYLSFFPMTLFLQAVYSESLYLLLALIAFSAAEQGRFRLAGVATGAAMLTRSAGLALLPALGLIAWRSGRRREAWIGLAIALLLFSLWPLWLWHSVGDPGAFVTAQRDWKRHLSPAGPVGGLWRGFHVALAGLHYLLGAGLPTAPVGGAGSYAQIALENIEAFCFAVLFVFLAIVAWRTLGSAYGTFAVVSLCIPLSVPTQFRPLLSMPRFGLAIFPLFLALGVLGARRNLHALLISCSALLLGIAIVQWARYEWVS